MRDIYIYIYTYHSWASLHLVAVVEGSKTTQRGQKRRKIAKSAENQRKNLPKWHV